MTTYISQEADNTADKVLMDQVKNLEDASVGSRLATVVMGALAVWMSSQHARHDWVLVWLAVQMVFNLGTIWAGHYQRQVPITIHNVQQRLRRSTILPAINGLLWASGILLMWVPGDFVMQLSIIFFIVGISSGSLHTLRPCLPALFMFFIPCVGSILVATLWFHDAHTVVVALGTSAYMIWCSGYGVTAHRALITSMYKHYEAAELAIKLQTQKEIAEAATHAKSRFLAAASHDMRQPMHALNLYLGALANYDLPAEARPVLDKVRECAQTMDDMFSALLDISRLDASVLTPNLNVFPVASMLRKVQLEFSQQARAKGLELRVAPCSALILSDPELLENILRNLVSNAVRYTINGKILIGCRRTGNGIRLGVYDTGIGIAAELQPAIYEEYFQIGNRERDRSLGLGLGLAIAQRQARLLQAPLTMRSVLGRGSVFEIALTCSALPVEVPLTMVESRHHEKGLRGALIVLVDDEAMILDAARLLLEQWGCQVITAGSGQEALQILATISRAPDAIICDHRLRNDETGVQLIAALRNEFNRDIPAVLITGDTSPDQFKAITAGGLPVLHKPLQSQVLENMLLDLLRMDD